MKISANEIKNGNILLHDGGLWKVIKQPEHTKPGKGPAYIQLEMKNIKTSYKLNTRLSSTDKAEKVSLEQQECQYLYTEGSKLILMNNDTFEQIEVDKEILDEKIAFLTDGMLVKLETYENQPLEIILPPNVVCEIEETEPVISDATAKSSYKPATLTNGLTVKVPSYIATGTKIKVKTEDISYVERVKDK
jgi:elongation factor P